MEPDKVPEKLDYIKRTADMCGQVYLNLMKSSATPIHQLLSMLDGVGSSVTGAVPSENQRVPALEVTRGHLLIGSPRDHQTRLKITYPRSGKIEASRQAKSQFAAGKAILNVTVPKALLCRAHLFGVLMFRYWCGSLSVEHGSSEP